VDTLQLARRIRAFRKLRGLTQQQLAYRLGMSVSVLGEIERGRRTLDEATTGRIAGELGVTQEELASDPSFR